MTLVCFMFEAINRWRLHHPRNYGTVGYTYQYVKDPFQSLVLNDFLSYLFVNGYMDEWNVLSRNFLDCLSAILSVQLWPVARSTYTIRILDMCDTTQKSDIKLSARGGLHILQRRPRAGNKTKTHCSGSLRRYTGVLLCQSIY
jgi:hypothetical protein